MLDTTHDTVIQQALELARAALGMDAAHFGTFVAGYEHVIEASGDADRFGVAPGLQVPLEETFCDLMVRGEIPNIVPDAGAEPALADLPLARDGVIGAYVGVPVSASDGTVFGAFCCLSAQPDPSLAARELNFMRALGQLVGDRLARESLETRERERLEELVAVRTAELERAQAETAHRLSRAVEFRDDDTGDHIERVGIMAERLARAAGQEESWCQLLRLAAPLHDIGKVAAPDRVLLKQGRLTDGERELMETHAEVGHAILANSSSRLLRLAASIARTHHERIDGRGYSHRLSDEEIPLEGRIVAIVDVFDALTHDRVYRSALPVDRALELMREDVGHFDPELLECFIEQVVPALPFPVGPASGA